MVVVVGGGAGGVWVVKNLVGEIIPGERMSKFSGNLVDD